MNWLQSTIANTEWQGHQLSAASRCGINGKDGIE